MHERLDTLLREASSALDAEVLLARPLRQRLMDRIAFGVMRATLFLTGHRY
jgi:cardiolipin synthase